ncbi:bacterial regulatory s, tetR family protein [Mycobacteroides abscessus 21]|uniref:Bacterial regulatory s, tetR family protein n=3 Tax=Mycobacteroides abscessus TaxID=36809 RepID=A0A829Q0F8_9MYCO|nr:bacterial regulatory s, tetR family protein [Mycobacteroides abscessus 21]
MMRNDRTSLPIIDDASPPKRRDAVRNRAALLDAAADLIAQSGSSAALTMDAVATRAGVGKGTVFRHFGSRAGLMLSLLDHSEEKLQEKILTGKPPLGPGADPVERIVAYGRAKIALAPVQAEMLNEAGDAIYEHGAYWIAVNHIRQLLTESGSPCEPLLAAQSLYASLDARLVLRQVQKLKISLSAIANSWEQVARAVAAEPPRDATPSPARPQ